MAGTAIVRWSYPCHKRSTDRIWPTGLLKMVKFRYLIHEDIKVVTKDL